MRVTSSHSGFIVAAFVALAVIAAAHAISEQHDDAARLVAHTHEVLSEVADLRTEVAEHQNAVRGYVLTERETELDRYKRSLDALVGDVARLRVLTVTTLNNSRGFANLSKGGTGDSESLHQCRS